MLDSAFCDEFRTPEDHLWIGRKTLCAVETGAGLIPELGLHLVDADFKFGVGIIAGVRG